MEILDILCLRLSSKGLMPVEIMKLLNDSFDVIQNGAFFSKVLMKQELEKRGWEKNKIMDDVTSDIIMLCFANSEDYEELRIPLHYNRTYALAN